jgi:methyl-accepting chemotaxis protein
MLKNMKIGRKLILTFILVALLSSIGGIVGLIVMTNMNSNYETALIKYGFAQGDVGLYTTEFNNTRVIMRNLIIDTDAQKIQTDTDDLAKSFAKLDVYFANIEKNILSEKTRKEYNDIKDNRLKFRAIADQEAELAKQNKDSEAYKLLTDQATPIANKIRTSAEGILNEKTTGGNQLANTLTSQGTAATIIILIVILGSLVISLIIALAIARSISKPVSEMAEAAQKMAEGNLHVQINVDSTNEIGQLAAAFAKSTASIRAYIAEITKNLGKIANGDLTVTTTDLDYVGDYEDLKNAYFVIVKSLNDTLGQINEASEQVSSGSGQVANGAQALAQGATEQASSVEELSATITEISNQIKENAEHAVDASRNVSHVSSEIEISNNHMSEMVTSMSQISDSSSKIGKIIKTIEDIAFQTNILALNAAVEAARAGAAGKGFAVVADEVRNLASKSAEAAKDTTALIENSMKQVENGTKIADETAKSLLSVVDSAKAVSDTVEKISQASNRQSDAIGQVTVGVEQISAVVQTNSATAEESAAASEELSGQAQTLKELVTRFKLLKKSDQPIQNKDANQSEYQTAPQKAGSEAIFSNSKY